MGKIGGREVKNPMAFPAPKINSPLHGATAKSPVSVPNRLKIK